MPPVQQCVKLGIDSKDKDTHYYSSHSFRTWHYWNEPQQQRDLNFSFFCSKVTFFVSRQFSPDTFGVPVSLFGLISPSCFWYLLYWLSLPSLHSSRILSPSWLTLPPGRKGLVLTDNSFSSSSVVASSTIKHFTDRRFFTFPWINIVRLPSEGLGNIK